MNQEDLAKRSLISVTWRSAVSWGGRLILLTRAILLARLLPVDVFGVVAFASTINTFASTLTEFGKSNAFLSNTEETENENKTAANFLTLSLAFGLVVSFLMIVGAMVFADGFLRIALIVLAVVSFINQVLIIPKRILVRRVQHRRLAVIDILSVLISSAIALALAISGQELWALLSIGISTSLIEIIMLYVWRPVWRVKLGRDGRTLRYLLNIGSRYFLSNLLSIALDRIDDLYVGAVLGTTELGFYSKAYNFAIYPRQILAEPVKSVAVGVYFQLAQQREKLSRAFFRINALMIRSGFYIAGLLILIAPTLINLLLGAKWLPMLNVFRLMVVFTLFDPVKNLVESLYISLGEANQLVLTRVLQLLVLIIGIILLGPVYGNLGVAVAVDIMVVFGIAFSLRFIRKYVDFSAYRLFSVPLVGTIIGVLVVGYIGNFWILPSMNWTYILSVGMMYSAFYFGFLFLLEKSLILSLTRYLFTIFNKKS